MKPLLLSLLLLLAGSVRADQANWKVVSATAQTSTPAQAKWTFSIQNVSSRTLELGEDWQTKGRASANLSLNNPESPFATHFMTLLAEPCHHPQNYLKVEPGATVTAVVPQISGFAQDRLNLVITERAQKVVVAALSEVAIKEEDPAATHPSPAPDFSKPPEK
jgi:hypothetical protein